MLLFFHLPLIRVRSMSPWDCISHVAPPRRSEYGRKLRWSTWSSWVIRAKRDRKAEPLFCQQGTCCSPKLDWWRTMARTASNVTGSWRETDSRELFRSPLLLWGNETRPFLESNKKSQGLTASNSPVLKRAWNPSSNSAAITSCPLLTHHPAIARVMSCVNGGALHGTS